MCKELLKRVQSIFRAYFKRNFMRRKSTERAELNCHPLCSFHFPTPFPDAFSALLGVYLFPSSLPQNYIFSSAFS